MKEATGELNMTVVVVVAVGILSVFFFGVLWPNIKTGLIRSSKCSNAICAKEKQSDGTVRCVYYEYDKKGVAKEPGTEITCVWKG